MEPTNSGSNRSATSESRPIAVGAEETTVLTQYPSYPNHMRLGADIDTGRWRRSGLVHYFRLSILEETLTC